MTKIDGFDKLEAALAKSGYNYAKVLTKETINTLKNIVLSWGEPDLKNAHSVLHDYFAMKVPSQMLREILSNNIKLANEVYGNGIRDTCQREIISYAVLRHMGMRDWPTNGEGRQVMQNFVSELKEKAPSFGIEFVIDIEKAIK
jgi:hypothetical protein